MASFNTIITLLIILKTLHYILKIKFIFLHGFTYLI